MHAARELVRSVHPSPVPGFCETSTGVTWDDFPAAIAGKVDSHGFHNPSGVSVEDELARPRPNE